MFGPLEIRLSRACLTFGLSKLIEVFIIFERDGLERFVVLGDSSLCGTTVVGCFISGLLTEARLSSVSVILPLDATELLLASGSLDPSVELKTHLK